MNEQQREWWDRLVRESVNKSDGVYMLIGMADAELHRLRAIVSRVEDVEGTFSDVVSRLMDEEHSPISFACAIRDYAKGEG